MGSVQHECLLKRCGHRPGDPAGKEGACISLKVNPWFKLWFLGH